MEHLLALNAGTRSIVFVLPFSLFSPSLPLSLSFFRSHVYISSYVILQGMRCCRVQSKIRRDTCSKQIFRQVRIIVEKNERIG